jgi:hypothetical protein
MKTEFNIINGKLYTDLDTPFDIDNNKIDVYTSVYWTAETKEEYELKEEIINNYRINHELFNLYAWCDISGFDYWVIQQQEENYVSIDVVLTKNVSEYSQEEMKIISDFIIIADDYFNNKLL